MGVVAGLFYVFRGRKKRTQQQQPHPVADVSSMQNPNEKTVAGQKQILELLPEDRPTDQAGRTDPALGVGGTQLAHGALLQ